MRYAVSDDTLPQDAAVSRASAEARGLLNDAVKGAKAAGMLFSGGLDTSVLAYIMPDAELFTVCFGRLGEDAAMAGRVARFLGMRHRHIHVSADEAVSSVPDVIRILGSFDPALPNDVAVYFAMREAKRNGFSTVVTGDGADELLAGYSYMRGMDDLDAYIGRIADRLYFSSNILGAAFDIEIIQPYLDPRFKGFCLALPSGMKIASHEGAEHGKWILRRAFEDCLPGEVIWQDKRPIEVGSGMSRLREIIGSLVCDEEYNEAVRGSGVKFFSKEHYYYYKIYCGIFGGIGGVAIGEKKCPGCGTGMPVDAFHCRLCGHVLDWKTV
ncbi:MAG: asparagine synthase-related protein [Candidatus Omnitrophota bacterium]